MTQPVRCQNECCPSNESTIPNIWDITPDGFFVCCQCGSIDRGTRFFDDRAPFEKQDPWKKQPVFTKRLEGVITRGRYKEKFHYNERVSQWVCNDPPIPVADWNRIEEEALSGKYGPEDELTRASIVQLTRDLKLQKYRERWKSILKRLNPTFVTETPPPEFLVWADQMFQILVSTFYKHRNDMPRSLVRAKDGQATTRQRHNFPSYNYTQRKLLEMYGIWDFHHEFPVPRSHNKLHALDDVFEKMCETLSIPFQRSAVIKRPKLRRAKN
jgi:hypothetical protein